MSVILIIVLLILIALFFMIGAHVLFELMAAFVPFLAILMGVVGIVVGLFHALKNTFRVYGRVFFKRGGKKK